MICFSLVAHENEAAVFDQVENIRRFIKKDYMIVLYNGGRNLNFGNEVCRRYHEVMLCPYSRPLEYRKTGRVLYDVTRWLRLMDIRYDYLVYLESDTMFIRSGFPEYLRKKMKRYDFLGQHFRKYNPKKDRPRSPGTKSMFRNWKRWKPFFRVNYFCKTSNPFQTYKYAIIQKILKEIDGHKLEQLLKGTKVEALGEMLFPTLAKKCGAKARTYPRSFRVFNHWKPALNKKMVRKAFKTPGVMFLHPVKSDRVRKWMMKKTG